MRKFMVLNKTVVNQKKSLGLSHNLFNSFYASSDFYHLLKNLSVGKELKVNSHI